MKFRKDKHFYNIHPKLNKEKNTSKTVKNWTTLTCVLDGTTPAVEIFTLGIGIISVSELDKLN